MFNFIKSELNKLNIKLVSCISLDECTVKRPYLLEKEGISSGSVIIFAVPYLTPEALDKERNISSYAVSRDYHLFFSSLFEQLLPLLREKFPEIRFAGFTDHSPIDEREAAAKAGLGFIGCNHLLITKEYSSYIFIEEIVTDAILPSFTGEEEYCLDCGRCEQACPVKMRNGECLSAVTQKKGELSEGEKALIRQSGCAWGCDICQEVCPYTSWAKKRETIYTEIDFFKNDTTPVLTSELIEAMSEEDFAERAYSWRGKAVITRNLKILEEKES